jgi:Nuclear pore protein 84 / 107.
VRRTSDPAASHLKIADRARKTEPPQNVTARDLLSQNPYTPTSTLAQAIMNASPLLTELIVVREWLQETALPPQHPEATTGYWKFTKHSVMQSLRSGTGHRDGLVKAMDPDAANREEGKGLAADDAVGLFLVIFSRV